MISTRQRALVSFQVQMPSIHDDIDRNISVPYKPDRLLDYD